MISEIKYAEIMLTNFNDVDLKIYKKLYLQQRAFFDRHPQEDKMCLVGRFIKAVQQTEGCLPVTNDQGFLICNAFAILARNNLLKGGKTIE